MPRISISYRRADTAGITGRIFDRLKQHYGPDSVFIDIDSMRMGRNYKTQIDAALSTTDVLLIIVGRQWLGPRPEGSNRILDENDPVRLEVEAATRYERPATREAQDGERLRPCQRSSPPPVVPTREYFPSHHRSAFGQPARWTSPERTLLRPSQCPIA